jgi:hypothetical protein
MVHLFSLYKDYTEACNTVRRRENTSINTVTCYATEDAVRIISSF